MQVDKKVSQLKAISHLAALIAGFSMVVLVEAQIQSDVPHVLVAAFGLSAACVVRLRCHGVIDGAPGSRLAVHGGSCR